MNSLKCPQCGLVNFATAPECKRCHVKFHQPESVSEVSPAADEQTSDLAMHGSNPEQVAEDNEPWSPPPPPPLPEYFDDDEPSGFSAPMILFAGYLLLTIALLGFQLSQLSELWHSKAWGVMTQPSSKLYVQNAEAMFYVEWILHILGIIASLILIIPLLVKMHVFLNLVRIYLLGGFLYFGVQVANGLILHGALAEKLPPNSGTEDLLKGLYWGSILKFIGFLVTYIWFRYFTTSERVKRTFVN